MLGKSLNNSEVQELSLKQLINRNVRLFVVRDDLIHSEISGNKWRKLKYNIAQALHLKKDGIFTFGGAYSNHLLAVASACNLIGLKSIGLVRGEELTKNSNSNLQRCSELGMELRFLPRYEYDLRNEKGSQEEWKDVFRQFHFVPEGGANYYGIVGCQEILNELPKEIKNQISNVFVAAGTTTTACGILLSLSEKTKLHVVSCLKGFQTLDEMKTNLYSFLLDNSLIDEYLTQVVPHENAHFGGYGKWNDELLLFIKAIEKESNLPLDKIYTGKAFWEMLRWIDAENIQNQSVLFVHTGGLFNGGI